MKPKKQFLLNSIIVTATVAFTGIALCHEKIIVIPKQETKPTTKKEVAVDPAVTMINTEVLVPVRHQELRRNGFSRSRPTRANRYELAETSSDLVEGARYFDILVTAYNPRKIKIQKQKKTTSNAPKIIADPKPKIYLKLKYLTASNQLLIKQGEDWVERKDHKYLKLIPKVVTKK